MGRGYPFASQQREPSGQRRKNCPYPRHHSRPRSTLTEPTNEAHHVIINVNLRGQKGFHYCHQLEMKSRQSRPTSTASPPENVSRLDPVARIQKNHVPLTTYATTWTDEPVCKRWNARGQRRFSNTRQQSESLGTSETRTTDRNLVKTDYG